MDFDFDKVAAQVAQAQLAAERFDFDKVAAQVAQAQLAAERFDFDKVAAQVAQAQLAAERFDFDKVAAQVAQAQLAAERFDLGKVAAQAEQAQLAASSFLAAMPELTPELFGGAWNERVALRLSGAWSAPPLPRTSSPTRLTRSEPSRNWPRMRRPWRRPHHLGRRRELILGCTGCGSSGFHNLYSSQNLPLWCSTCL